MGGVVEGLFGQTPYEIRQHRDAMQQQQAQQYGQQDPMSAIRQAQYGAGSQIGNMINSVTGYVSPEERQAQQAQQIQAQIDTSTPEGLMRGAQMFNQAGNPQMAQRLVQSARQMVAERSRLNYEAAKTQREEAQADEIPKQRHNESLARIAQAAEAAKLRSEDTRLAIEQRREAAMMHNSMMRQIAQMKSDNRNEEKPISPAQRFKEEQAQSKSSSAIRSLETELENATADAETLKKHPGLGGATGIRGAFPSMPDGDAARAEALLTEFKAQVKKTGLNLVRQGGGIGSMTEREWPIVEGMVANIDPVRLGSQGTKDQIDKVIAKMKGVLANAKESHSELYGSGGKLHPAPNNKPNRIRFDAMGNQL